MMMFPPKKLVDIPGAASVFVCARAEQANNFRI